MRANNAGQQRREAGRANRAAEREAARPEHTKRQTSMFRRFRRRLGAHAHAVVCAPRLLKPDGAHLARRTHRPRPGELLMRQRRNRGSATLWHGRMLAMMPLRQPHRSQHRRARLAERRRRPRQDARYEKFRCQVVRGSLSKPRRDARCARCSKWCSSGGQLVLTPDGPRGPRHSVNSGAAWLARATGRADRAVVGVGDHPRLAPAQLGSHDASRSRSPASIVHYGDPIHIGRRRQRRANSRTLSVPPCGWTR